MTREEATERVARGAALLDEKRPGWARAIDVGKLDLGSNCACILGQLEGSFNKCVNEYGGRAASFDCGFNVVATPHMYDDYQLLQTA